MTNQQTPESPHSQIPFGIVAMCDWCERVPVPVHFVNFSLYRGLYVCAGCLAEEGIHVEESDLAEQLYDCRIS